MSNPITTRKCGSFIGRERSTVSQNIKGQDSGFCRAKDYFLLYRLCRARLQGVNSNDYFLFVEWIL